MGIAMLAAVRLMQVVPVWVDGLRPSLAADSADRPLVRASLDHGPAAWQDLSRHGVARVTGRLWARLVQRRHPDGGPLTPRAACNPTHPRPLRVLRVLEPQQPRAAAGRMVISGRMADVCAELDRLAAAEVATRP